MAVILVSDSIIAIERNIENSWTDAKLNNLFTRLLLVYITTLHRPISLHSSHHVCLQAGVPPVPFESATASQPAVTSGLTPSSSSSSSSSPLRTDPSWWWRSTGAQLPRTAVYYMQQTANITQQTAHTQASCEQKKTLTYYKLKKIS